MKPAKSMTSGHRILFALLCFSMAFLKCSFQPSVGFPITVHSKSITLEWDPPWSILASNFAGLAEYRVYYRPHFSVVWSLLGRVPAGSPPELVVPHDRIGDGAWDFAVTTMSTTGIESGVHTSTDDSAQPTGGWYIIWQL